MIVLLTTLGLHAQEQDATPGPVRLFEQSQFAIVVLADQDRTEQRVLPLELPAGGLPDDPKFVLQVRLVERPEQVYEIARSDIAEVRTFGQLVMAEAEALVRAGKFDDAYDYYAFLLREHGKLPGLTRSLGDYLLADARAQLAAGHPDLAATLLNELHARDAKHPGLSATLGEAIDKLAAKCFQEDDLAGTRQLLDGLSKKFPDHPTTTAWKARFVTEARQLLAAARSSAEKGEWSSAIKSATKAQRLDPTLAAAREFLAEAYREHPRVVVSVTEGESADWGRRRVERLHARRLLEFTGPGPDGGLYTCPVGSLEKENLDRRLVIRLRPDAGLTGYELARTLTSMARRDAPDFAPQWATIAGSIEVRDVYELVIDLRRTHLKSEALLGLSLPRASHPMAVEIEERMFPNSEAALAALDRGEVDVVDRVQPWDVPRLRERSDLSVMSYCVPTVHVLVPNLARPLVSLRSFRRALEFGIDRQRILTRDILRGKKETGCEVASGPFPSGLGFEDPLRYAYNDLVKPRPFEPRLAMTLATIALTEANAAAKAAGQPKPGAKPLVLQHPPRDLPRVACRAIRDQLAPLGIAIELRESESSLSSTLADDVDLLYTELWMPEPLVDARRLFSPRGILGGASPYIQLALGQLDAADGWQAARARLQQIHQLAHDESAVIPLWQLTEHAVSGRNVQGLGQRPATLYQHVESWRIEPRASPEGKRP